MQIGYLCSFGPSGEFNDGTRRTEEPKLKQL